MEKRLFNQIIKQQLLSYGFEKTSTQDYAKEATDSMTKLIIRIPDAEHDFCVGVQFKDFDKQYSDYSGKFSKRCMSYSGLPKQFGLFEDPYNSSSERIVDAVKNVVNSIEVFLQNGREAVLKEFELWISSVISEKQKNDIYAYFDMPLIEPYSDAYIIEKIEEWYKCGVKSMITLDEYFNHKEHYDKYINYGCQISIGKEFVTISYEQ